MITEGRLGRLHSFQVNAIWNRPPDYYLNSPWHGQKAKDGGILFTQFSHFIDLLPGSSVPLQQSTPIATIMAFPACSKQKIPAWPSCV